jgi:hypothetical protein
LSEKKVFAYTAALLAIVVSSPCRFASGIVLFIFFNLTVLFGSINNYLALRLKLNHLIIPLLVYFCIFFSVFYKMLLVLYSPVVALSTGFSLYITAFCAYETAQFTQKSFTSFKIWLKSKLQESLKFSLCFLVVFFLRELFGAGVISLPAPQYFFSSGLIELQFPQFEFLYASIFFASIPGIVILTALFMTIFLIHTKKRAVNDN